MKLHRSDSEPDTQFDDLYQLDKLQDTACTEYSYCSIECLIFKEYSENPIMDYTLWMTLLRVVKLLQL